ncbi:MAG: hypothetical protein AAF907_01580 [Planctomycetota bacterium]
MTRLLWPGAIGLAVVWAAALGTLAAVRSDPLTLNRVQFERAEAIVLLEVSAPTANGVRGVVNESIPAGGGAVPEELTEGAKIAIGAFPKEAAVEGFRAAVPVRRAGRSWEVAPPPERLPRLVYPVANPEDWSDLKAAAAALAAGEPAYR